ncbi:MAG: glycosyltransferase family 4 protein [Rhodospirillaceae bacterium]|jgi:alpha-maltose-1-phosphate synthase|nr:glycosyltransferase family 4 protein [Rhodospirillaceae bacterium]MBT5676257.1 glycosyltransferase family 4 protein [Rhodospirillaceae bacterium]MBT5781338.1 glycosyltransferase family 4 protein [Rhodospirillaceae bacterium]
MRATAAIFYHPEGFDTSGSKLMGRQAAGEAFLKAYAEHGGVSQLYCYTKSEAMFSNFRERLTRLTGGERAAQSAEWIPHHQPNELAKAGCLFVPGPNTADLAWQRRHFDVRGYSICGVTHTTASEGIMDSIGDLMVAPYQSWDAVICTSEAVRETYRQVLGDWADYLAERTRGIANAPVQLPIIPLGIDCATLRAEGKADAWRKEWRERLEIGDEDIVLLFMGRLSYHAKAHPLPMYLGLENAARESKRKIHLIQAGWFANDSIEKAFKASARSICPSVNAHFLDGRDGHVRESLWYAADIFTSLSDNIQESFGLTPLEAMATGLPVVVSDWNGYRDTIVDGETGIAVPTVSLPPGMGGEFAFRHAAGLDSYDRYLGHASLCTSIDAGACARAYLRLIEDDELRRKMGAAGQRHATEKFDWQVVVAAYQALWDSLSARRRSAAIVADRAENSPANPLRNDPFALFAGYPTAYLDGKARIALNPGAAQNWFKTIRKDPMVSFASYMFLSDDETDKLLERLDEMGECDINAVLAASPPESQGLVHRTLAWLTKLNVLRIVSARKRTGG